MLQLCGGCEVCVLSHALAIREAPDGSPVYVRCAGVRGAVGMKGASHAHVPDYRETAPERKAAQLDVRRVRVIRIRVPDEPGYEESCTRSRAVDSFQNGR